MTARVAVLFGLSALIGYDLRAYHRRWVDDLNAQAELLGRTTAPALELDDARVAQENLSLLHPLHGIGSAALYSRSDKRENALATRILSPFPPIEYSPILSLSAAGPRPGCARRVALSIVVLE